VPGRPSLQPDGQSEERLLAVAETPTKRAVVHWFLCDSVDDLRSVILTCSQCSSLSAQLSHAGRCTVSLLTYRRVKLTAVLLRRNSLDSRSHTCPLPWGTCQLAMILSGWEGNRRPSESNGSLPPSLCLTSSANGLPCSENPSTHLVRYPL